MPVLCVVIWEHNDHRLLTFFFFLLTLLSQSERQIGEAKNVYMG